jgi:hypothetical protein
LDELTDVFRQLGAPHPEDWARSQINEGIPQLARYLFLKHAWNCVVGEGQDTWIEDALKPKDSDPGGAGAAALRRLLAAGANRQDLTSLVRTMQWRTLFGICYLLENSFVFHNAMPPIEWALVQLDEEGRPTAHISGLHESVLETDPTGREMRLAEAEPER